MRQRVCVAVCGKRVNMRLVAAIITFKKGNTGFDDDLIFSFHTRILLKRKETLF